MKVAYCPYCNNRTLIDDRDWGLLIQCEGPRCEKFFTTAHLAELERVARSTPLPPESAPSPKQSGEPPFVKLFSAVTPRFGFRDVPAVPPAFATPRPRLTGPHVCQVCKAPIHEAFGKRRDTVLHRNPDRPDNCRTDVYAALYQCPACLTLLETPGHQCGREIVCPVVSCKQTFIAPHDDILHRHEGDVREGEVFYFDCPTCVRILCCDTRRGGEPTTGLPVVCTWCSHLVFVPAGGWHLGPRAASAVDPVQAVQQAADRRCPRCNNRVPTDSDCPLCSPVTLPGD